MVYFYSPMLAYAGLGVSRPISKEDETQVTAETLLVFGFFIFMSGYFAVRKGKYGPEEGMRGNYLKGIQASFWGGVQCIVGAIMILAGLSILTSR